MRSDTDDLTYLIFGGTSASLIDRVGRPELTFGNVGMFGCESLEPVDVGMLHLENKGNENK
jgi:hypothetical protein